MQVKKPGDKDTEPSPKKAARGQSLKPLGTPEPAHSPSPRPAPPSLPLTAPASLPPSNNQRAEIHVPRKERSRVSSSAGMLVSGVHNVALTSACVYNHSCIHNRHPNVVMVHTAKGKRGRPPNKTRPLKPSKIHAPQAPPTTSATPPTSMLTTPTTSVSTLSQDSHEVWGQSTM